MNKKIFKVAVVAVVAFVAGLNVYQSQAEIRLTDLQMENVEALAGGECLGSLIKVVDQGWLCYNVVAENMSGDYFLCMKCSDCSIVPVVYLNNSGQCGF